MYGSSIYFLTSESFCSSDAKIALNSTRKFHSFWGGDALPGLILIKLSNLSGHLGRLLLFYPGFLSLQLHKKKKNLPQYFMQAFVLLF